MKTIRNSLGVVAMTCWLGVGVAGAQTSAEQVGCSDAALGVGLDAWGRTLVAGAAYDNRIVEWDTGHAHYADLALSRLMPDGSVDADFGRGGNLLLDVGDFDELSEVVALGPWVYAAGVTAPTMDGRRGDRDLVVLRLGPTGQLDPTFGATGKVTLDLGGDDELAGLALDPAGGVWLSGSTALDSASDGFILRLTPEGVLDPDVADQGVFRVDTGSDSDRLLSIRVLANRVYAGGVSTVDGQAAAIALGLDLEGTPLASFGDQGLSLFSVGETLGDAAVSFHGSSGSTAVTLTHLGSDGSVHAVTTLFDARGQVAHPGPEVQLPAGTSPTGGSFWWGGALYLSGAIYNEDFSLGDAFLTRLAGEALDSSFGGGLVREHLALEYAAYYDLAASLESVTVAGWEFSEQAETLGDSNALVARYTADGVLDKSFGNGGIVLHDFRGGAAVCGPAVFLP